MCFVKYTHKDIENSIIKLLDKKVDFLDERGDKIDLNTNFLKTGFNYKDD